MLPEPLRFPTERLDPRVVTIHPDESLLDLLQYELERAGVATRALVPDSELGLAALIPYLPQQLDLCVVGLCPPYSAAWGLLAALQAAYPACTVILTAADPGAAVPPCHRRGAVVQETPDVEQTVAAIVAVVQASRLGTRLVDDLRGHRMG